MLRRLYRQEMPADLARTTRDIISDFRTDTLVRFIMAPENSRKHRTFLLWRGSQGFNSWSVRLSNKAYTSNNIQGWKRLGLETYSHTRIHSHCPKNQGNTGFTARVQIWTACSGSVWNTEIHQFVRLHNRNNRHWHFKAYQVAQCMRNSRNQTLLSRWYSKTTQWKASLEQFIRSLLWQWRQLVATLGNERQSINNWADPWLSPWSFGSIW